LSWRFRQFQGGQIRGWLCAGLGRAKNHRETDTRHLTDNSVPVLPLPAYRQSPVINDSRYALISVRSDFGDTCGQDRVLPAKGSHKEALLIIYGNRRLPAFLLWHGFSIVGVLEIEPCAAVIGDKTQ